VCVYNTYLRGKPIETQLRMDEIH